MKYEYDLHDWSVTSKRLFVVNDPCSSAPCHRHANCEQITPTDYTCSCKEGYLGNGSICHRDRCGRNHGGCPPTSSCSVDPSTGKLSCRCYSGYSGPDCEDLDECLGSDACGQNALCLNVLGSYSCYCPPGYTGDGRTGCFDIGMWHKRIN